MARGRVYSVSFANVAVAAVQDLVSLLATANMALELHGFDVGQTTKTTVEMLRVSVWRTLTPVVGSGGGAFTPLKAMSGDVAATATARINDTTQMTFATKQVLYADVFNVVNGISFWWPPEDRPIIGPSQGMSLSLDTAPAASMNMSGTLFFAELL